MAHGHVSYTDLTQAQRSAAADKIRSRIKTTLANPVLPKDQRAVLRQRLETLRLWEAGKLGVQHHVVQATETVAVKEGME